MGQSRLRGVWGPLVVSLALVASCGRERTNPIDPNFAGNETLSPPTGVKATGDIGQILVSWNAVTSGDLAGYGVWRSTEATSGYRRLPGEVTDTLITTARTTFVDSTIDLSVAKVYYYKLSTVDVNRRSSDLSLFVSAEALEDNRPPAAPSDLSAVGDASTGYVTLTWSAPLADAGGLPLTGLGGYRIFRSKDTQDSFVQIAEVSATATAFVDSASLETGVAYYYRVSAVDGAANVGSRSTAASIRSGAAGLATPTGLRTTSRIGEIELTWNAVTDPLLVGYLLLRSTNTASGFTAVTVEAITTARTEYVDQSVTPGQVVFYKVQAVGSDPSAGTIRSAESAFVDGQALFDEVPPAAPRDVVLTVDETNPRRVTLSWTPPLTDSDGGELTGLDSFQVFRSRQTSSSFVRIAGLSVAQTTYTDTTVVPLTTYFYAVSAVDSAANVGPRSSSVSVTTTGLARPTGVRVTAGARKLEVSWNANTEPELTGYEVLRYTDPSQTTPGATFTTAQTAYVDSPLTVGQSYVYRVRAVGLNGLASETSAFITGTVASDLSAPRNVTATGGTRRVTVSWTANTEPQLTGYRVLRLAGASDQTALATFTTVQTTYVDSPLTKGQTFVYRVQALGSGGLESERSLFASATVSLEDLVAPRNVTATGGIRRITVSWTANTEAVLTGYRVLRFAGASDTAAVATFTTAQTTYVDSPLVAGQTFVYRVQALGSGGLTSDRSSYASATVAADDRAPSSPPNVGSRLVSTSTIEVTWLAPTTDAGGLALTGLSRYRVYRATGSTGAGFSVVAVVDSTVTSYQDTGLNPDVDYFYRVTALDSAGNESGASSTVTQKTSSSVAAPTNVAATADATPRATITWTNPSSFTSFRIERREIGSSSSGTFSIVAATVFTSPYEDNSVQSGRAYIYRMLTNLNGQFSSPSTEVTVAVP